MVLFSLFTSEEWITSDKSDENVKVIEKMQKASARALLKGYFFFYFIHLFTSCFVNSELATRVISPECLIHFMLGYSMYIFLHLFKNCSCETSCVTQRWPEVTVIYIPYSEELLYDIRWISCWSSFPHHLIMLLLTISQISFQWN